MSETRFDEMKRYVRLGADEARLLAAFGAVAAPSFPAIVDEFYERVREHEDAHAVFTGEDQIARLKSSMVCWLGRVCGGVYDDAYFEETAKIGRVHVKVGLPQHYMFTAMALMRVALGDLADRALGADGPSTRTALNKLLDLELAIMLESYREHFVARIQQVDRVEKAELGRSLAQAEHRYKSAVELAGVIIIGIDSAGRIRLFNGEAERVTGLGRDEARGKVFVDLLIPAESHDTDGVRVARALEAGASPSGEIFDGVIATRSGHVRSIRWQLAASPSALVDEVVLFAIGQDRTEEAALAERTHQHEKLAAVGTLAAGLAHEIRNPLNGAQLHVAYLARSLKRSAAAPDLLEAVSVVADEIKRLAALVTEFLDFARPKPLIREALSVRTLCERSLHLVTPEASSQQVALHADIPSHDVTLHGDSHKLEQVLLNLLNNAIEACSEGNGSTITLRARRQPRHVVFEIEDDGPGLVRPDAPIFDAFFSTKPAGTGLGLAITHRIVTDHSGAVTVESRAGRTVFRVTLPVDAPSERTISTHSGGAT